MLKQKLNTVSLRQESKILSQIELPNHQRLKERQKTQLFLQQEQIRFNQTSHHSWLNKKVNSLKYRYKDVHTQKYQQKTIWRPTKLQSFAYQTHVTSQQKIEKNQYPEKILKKTLTKKDESQEENTHLNRLKEYKKQEIQRKYKKQVSDRQKFIGQSLYLDKSPQQQSIQFNLDSIDNSLQRSGMRGEIQTVRGKIPQLPIFKGGQTVRQGPKKFKRSIFQGFEDAPQSFDSFYNYVQLIDP